MTPTGDPRQRSLHPWGAGGLRVVPATPDLASGFVDLKGVSLDALRVGAVINVSPYMRRDINRWVASRIQATCRTQRG